MLVLGRLNLLEHRLGLLKENESLLKTFLGDEVDGALVELVDHDRHLVYT